MPAEGASEGATLTTWLVRGTGTLFVVLGGLYLFVDLLLPRLLAASERAQGIGIYDPQLGGDPILAGPHRWDVVAVAAVLVIAGAALIARGRLLRRR